MGEYTCQHCGMVTHNQNDAEYGYCGACHKWMDDAYEERPPRPGSMSGTGYWMYETTGELRPTVEAYLRGDDMTAEQIAVMRDYLRRWIFCPFWRDDGDGISLNEMRRRVVRLTSRSAIDAWIEDVQREGIDPL
jgi:hypothetical protein